MRWRGRRSARTAGRNPGVVPATSPIDAVGAIAISVALRMPPVTFSRSASQSWRVVRSTAIGTPRSASVDRDRVEGHEPLDQPDPSKFAYVAALPREIGRGVDRVVGDELR